MDEELTQTIETGADAVRAFMEDAGWAPQAVEGRNAWRVPFGDDYPVVGCVLEIQADRPRFTCHLLLEPSVPQARCPTMAEFVARANQGLDVGNFDFDQDTGAVRYKVGLSFYGERLTKGLVGNLVVDAIDSANLYALGFLEVIDAEMSARKAIALSEGADNLDDLD